MKKQILIAAIAAMVSLPLAVHAADEKKKGGGAFAAADANHDGKLSPEEFAKAVEGKMDDAAAKARFKALDKDNDGFLTREEFAAGGAGKKGGGKKKTEN